MLNIAILIIIYTKCHYAECHIFHCYIDGRRLRLIILKSIKINVVILFVMFSVTFLDSYEECHYAACHNADCCRPHKTTVWLFTNHPKKKLKNKVLR